MSDQIRGEWWVTAEGDILAAASHGMHSVLAIEQLIRDSCDGLHLLAKSYARPALFMDYDEEPCLSTWQADFNDLYQTILESQVDRFEQIDDVWDYIAERSEVPRELLETLARNQDASLYCVRYLGWIAIRGQYADVWDYAKSRRRLAKAVLDIYADENDIDDAGELPQDAEFHIHNYANNRYYAVTLADLEEVELRLPVTNR